MAIKKQFHLVEGSGLEAWIEFNDANLRISDFVVIVPAGTTCHVWVVETGNLFEQTYTEGQWEQNIPGNHRVISDGIHDGEEAYRLPVEIEWGITWPG